MGTELEHPDPKPEKKKWSKALHPVWEGLSIGALASRWGRAREDAEKATGTKDHPRLVVHHELAALQYSHMWLWSQFNDLQNSFCNVKEELGELRRLNEYYLSILESLPERILLLENSHALLTLRAGKASFIDDVVKAYELGKQTELESKPRKDDNHDKAKK